MKPAKRALFVTPWLPIQADWTRSTGLTKRQHILIDALKCSAETIDVLFFVSDKVHLLSERHRDEVQADLCRFWGSHFNVHFCPWRHESSSKSAWSHYGAPVLNTLHHKRLGRSAGPDQSRALAARLAQNPDVVLFHRLECALALFAGRQKVPLAFLDLDDIEHVAFVRKIKEPPVWPGKYLEGLQVPALMAAERKAISLMRKTFVCSEADRRYLRRLFRTSRVDCLPNAVAPRAPTVPSTAPTLLLLGLYSYAPNRLGAEFMLDHVWPRVRARRPDATLIVAGAGPEAIRKPARGLEGVSFPGFVEDLDALYGRARAVVCPILSGAGTRLKILEAASFSRPVVSTRIGAEGLDLVDAAEILLADSPEDFANACVRLLDDHAAASRIGTAARQKVDALYSRPRIVDHLASIFRTELVAQGKGIAA